MDIQSLEYTPEDVHRCLAGLHEMHFQHAERYPDQKAWLDVYRICYTGPTGHEDELYIKLKLDRDCVFVILRSFHQERSI